MEHNSKEEIKKFTIQSLMFNNLHRFGFTVECRNKKQKFLQKWQQQTLCVHVCVTKCKIVLQMHLLHGRNRGKSVEELTFRKKTKTGLHYVRCIHTIAFILHLNSIQSATSCADCLFALSREKKRRNKKLHRFCRNTSSSG